MKRKIIFLIGSLLLISCPLVKAATLQDVVVQTIQTNPDVLIKLKGWMAAQKGIQQARGGYFPTIDLDGELGAEQIDDPTKPNEETLHPVGVGLSLSQMIFDGFQTFYEVKRNKKLSEADQYALIGTANDTALLASRVYIDVMRTQNIVYLAQENYKTQQDIYRMIQRRSETGLGRKADISQSYGRLAKAKANLLASQNNYSDAVDTYFKVVGLMPSNLRTPMSPRLSMLPSSKNDAITKAIADHPFLKAAKADIEEAQAQYGAAKSTNYPRIHGVLSTDNGNDIFGDQGRYIGYRAAIELRYNLFRGGSDLAYQQKTGILIEQAQQIMTRTYDQVIENMKLAWNNLQTARYQLTYFQRHRDASIETTNAYYQQFTVAKRTLLDLLNSEDEQFKAKVDYVNGQYDLLFSKYRVLNGYDQLLPYLQVQVPMEQSATRPKITTHDQVTTANSNQPKVVTNPNKQVHTAHHKQKENFFKYVWHYFA